VLTVRRSKTDQDGAGQAAAIWRSDNPDLCAPTALHPVHITAVRWDRNDVFGVVLFLEAASTG